MYTLKKKKCFQQIQYPTACHNGFFRYAVFAVLEKNPTLKFIVCTSGYETDATVCALRVATSQLGTIMLFCFIVVPRPPNKTNTMRSFSPRGFSYSPFSHSVLSAPRSWRVSINTHPSTSTKFSMILISI